MGQGQSQIQVIGILQFQTQDPNQKPIENPIENILKKAFKEKAKYGGRLYKSEFNEALQIIDDLSSQQLKDTPLSERLFSILDKVFIFIDKQKKIGYLEENDYISGLKMILYDREKRIEFSFQLLDKDNDRKVSRQEFFDFIKETWIFAFQRLATLLDKTQQTSRYGLSYAKITQWSQSQLGQLQKEISTLCQLLDPKNTQYLDFSSFRQWIQSDAAVTIIARLDNNIVEVPLNLYRLEIKKQ
ncbi:hypothetical protein pb186bvf_019286 [Paramecium bursaria]